MIKMITFLTATLIAASASAVDVTKCPKFVSFRADIDKVVKNSIYSGTPGWKDAQSALLGITSVEVRLSLKSKTAKACLYKDFDGNSAALSTASFLDPEEQNPSLSDQLIVNLSIDGSRFVTYVPVKGYDLNGVLGYSSPFRLKIKAQLLVNNRWGDYDIGMINTYMK